MIKVLALLYAVAFVIFLVALVCAIVAKIRKREHHKITYIWAISLAVFLISFIAVGVMAPSKETQETEVKDSSTNDSKGEETTNNENTEQNNTADKPNDVVVEQAANEDIIEETTEVSEYDAIDKCYEELCANNNAKDWNEFSKQIKELADKYGLYQDSKNNGLGVRYAKIAMTRDESKVTSNSDLDKGTYYIRIVADFSKGSPDIQLIDNTDSAAGQTEEMSAQKTPEELYFEQVKHDAEWQMMPRERCEEVTLEDRTLRLVIYLTSTDKLLERYTDISKAILDIESGYDWWDTLVIDFGSQGIVTKTKDELVDENFEITKDDFVKN